MSDKIVVIASGPSLTGVDIAACMGRARVLAVNDCYRVAPWADWLYACDWDWWKAAPRGELRPNYEISKHVMTGERWTRDRAAADEFGLHFIESRDLPGLSTDPKIIHEGENGGYQAINLAVHFRRHRDERIVLLGFDMTGTSHWFGSHPQGLCDATDFSERRHHFDQLARDLASLGVDVVNASRETGLDQFRRATLEEALA